VANPDICWRLCPLFGAALAEAEFVAESAFEVEDGFARGKAGNFARVRSRTTGEGKSVGGLPTQVGGRRYWTNPWATGILRPLPKARLVTFKPGAA
jgi:hypothetical protein